MKKTLLIDNQMYSSPSARGIRKLFSMYISVIGHDFNVVLIPHLRSNFTKLNTVINKLISIIYLLFSKYTIFLPSGYSTYFLNFVKTPVVVTIHDFTHEVLPHLSGNRKKFISRKKSLLQSGQYFIFNSNNTQSDALKFYGSSPNQKYFVVYPFVDHNSSFVKKKKLYFLYVGNRQPYKNFSICLEFMNHLKKSSFQLICVGGGSFTESEVEQINFYGISKQVKQVSANDNQLTQLYKHAFALVYPSFYEGFGLPLLEASQNNCPILCSDIPVFREILGQSGFYFNPSSASSLLHITKNLCQSKSDYFESILSQRLYLQRFSKQHTRMNLLKALQEAAK